MITTTTTAPVPLMLVDDEVSEDTVAHYRKMLALAERGEVIGGASVTWHKARGYALAVFGEALDSPIFMRGLIAELDDRLGRLSMTAPAPAHKPARQSKRLARPTP